jgi:hypothetical protein
LMINYDPKVAGYARTMEMGNALGLEGLTATRLLDAFVAFQRDHSRNLKILERKREEQVRAAELNVERVVEFVKG